QSESRILLLLSGKVTFCFLSAPPTGSSFVLRVQVSDMLTGRPLSKAAVELFVNHTLRSAAFSGGAGDARLHVPFHAGLPVAVATSKQVLSGLCFFIPAVFSSVTLSLLALTRGNVWLFDDSVLITSRTAGGIRRPDFSLMFTGFVSVELNPVAAVSVQLFSGDVELDVSGPIQITLHRTSCMLTGFMVIHFAAGGWMRNGLGKMTLVDGKLMWTFTAPHLGYWIAAPLTSSRGRFSLQMRLSPVKRTEQEKTKAINLGCIHTSPVWSALVQL
uniref:FAM171 N-terminal domain-containing protein n=1 Tax=Poecilia latipinna TaxID=48699 RepID=A0A3B3TQ37_9TELE